MDDDSDEDIPSTRKRRGQLQRDDTLPSDFGELVASGKGTDSGVKEVTQGGKEVERQDKLPVTQDDAKPHNAPVESSPTADEPVSTKPSPLSATPKELVTVTATQDDPATAAVVLPPPSPAETGPIAPVEPETAVDPASQPLPESDSEDEGPSPKDSPAIVLPDASDVTTALDSATEPTPTTTIDSMAVKEHVDTLPPP